MSSGHIHTMQAQVKFDATFYPVAVVSCMFFFWLCRYVIPSLSAYFIPTFKTLSEPKQAYWHSSVNSSVHAVVVSCMCVYAMVYEEGLRTDPVWHNSSVVKSSCAVVVGYMFADCIIMVINYRHYGDVYTLLHHAASVYAYYYVMTYGVFVYFANYRLLAELSTVFVNNRWMLDNLGYDKTGTVYIWNGTILTAVFFACRILTLPWCWYMIYSIYGTEASIRAGNITFVLHSSCFVLDVLNLFWFFKLLKGVHKTLKKKEDANKNLTAHKAE